MPKFFMLPSRLFFLGSVITGAALLLCSPAMAQATAQAAPQDAPQAVPQPAPAAADPGGVNAIARVAAQQGVLACASRINLVTNFLGFNAQAAAMLMVPPSQVDQRLLPLIMETATESGPAYVSATFAPNQGNGCGATYDAVVYWPLACEAVATKQFATLKNVGPLKKGITLLDGGVALKVFLMPAGSGCVSIKKEMVL